MRMTSTCQFLQSCIVGVLIANSLGKSISQNSDSSSDVNYEVHLQNLGYLQRGRSETTPDEFQSAVEQYQTFFHLSVTGRIDPETEAHMRLPRCQIPDFREKESVFARYTLAGVRWRVWNITWKLNKVDGTYPRDEIHSLVEDTFRVWERPSQLRFIEADDATIVVDLVMPDASGYHGDSVPFGDRTLAHAFYPSNDETGGDVHVNMKLPYYTYNYNSRAYDLYQVVVHELGHSLGLAHSNVEGSIMYPTVGAGVRFKGLHPDDARGIQALYGTNSQWSAVSGVSLSLPSTPVLIIGLISLLFNTRRYNFGR